MARALFRSVLNEVDQADLEESIRGIPHVDTVVGYASALNGSIPSEILPDDIRGRFENGNDRPAAHHRPKGKNNKVGLYG